MRVAQGEPETTELLPVRGGFEALHTADFEEACYATPALASGSVWLRTQQSLYRLGTID